MFTIISKELSKTIIGGQATEIDCTVAENAALPECVTPAPTGKRRKYAN